MRRDFEYWGLDELSLEPCCAIKFYPQLDVSWLGRNWPGILQV